MDPSRTSDGSTCPLHKQWAATASISSHGPLGCSPSSYIDTDTSGLRLLDRYPDSITSSARAKHTPTSPFELLPSSPRSERHKAPFTCPSSIPPSSTFFASHSPFCFMHSAIGPSPPTTSLRSLPPSTFTTLPLRLCSRVSLCLILQRQHSPAALCACASRLLDMLCQRNCVWSRLLLRFGSPLPLSPRTSHCAAHECQ